jgi:hypothetical protein
MRLERWSDKVGGFLDSVYVSGRLDHLGRCSLHHLPRRLVGGEAVAGAIILITRLTQQKRQRWKYRTGDTANGEIIKEQFEQSKKGLTG